MQVDFQQRRQVSRITDFLKCVELILYDQSQFAEQAELIRSRYNNPPARFAQAGQFPYKCSRVLEVLDCFDCRYHVRRFVSEINAGSIQIDLVELTACGKTVIVNNVCSDVTAEPIVNVQPQVPSPAPDIDECAATAMPMDQGAGDGTVNRLGARSLTQPGTPFYIDKHNC